MKRIGQFVTVVAGSALLFACGTDADTSATPLENQHPGPGDTQNTLDASVPMEQQTWLGDGSLLSRDGSGSTGGGTDASCGATVVEAKQVVVQQQITVEERIDEVQPVALYITLDQSLSMDWENLWTPAKDAIKSFVNAQSSSGIDVALEFFPEGGSQCNGSGYDTPAIGMGRLPAHAADIVAALDKRKTAGGVGTPIEGALRGATQFCQNFEKTSNGEKCVAVLVTDGDPLGCEGDPNKLAAIVQAAYANGSGVRTFAVGLKGADFTLLDKIAQSGGAVDCDTATSRFSCDVSAGPEQLSAALDKIRSVVTTVKTHVQTTTRVEEMPIDCEWVIPTPTEGPFDSARVNVQLSAPSLAAPIHFGQVASPAKCAAKGWYYDDPANPARLVACPETCTLLKATPQARVDVLLGCATQPLLL